MSTYSRTTEFSAFEAFKAPTDLNETVQKHLIKVYATLLGLCLVAGLGVYSHVMGLFFFGGGMASFLIGIAALIGITSIPDTPRNKLIRYGLLGVFGYMEGLSIGPMVKYALAISLNNNILINTCIVTGLIFSSFTLAAMFTNKAYYIYLGGLLSSVLNVLLWTSFANAFVGSKFIFDIEIYVGLLMFVGYVIYDTQLIIHRATEFGSRDEIGDALTLFIDLVGIFVRILLILSEKSEKDGRKQKQRGSRRKAGYAGQ